MKLIFISILSYLLTSNWNYNVNHVQMHQQCYGIIFAFLRQTKSNYNSELEWAKYFSTHLHSNSPNDYKGSLFFRAQVSACSCFSFFCFAVWSIRKSKNYKNYYILLAFDCRCFGFLIFLPKKILMRNRKHEESIKSIDFTIFLFSDE